MSLLSNKTACRALVQKVYNEGRLELIDELVAEGAVDHGLGRHGLEHTTTPRWIAGFLLLCRQAFPDLRVEIEDMVAEGDHVVTRWRLTGTHTGPLTGFPASGQPVDVSGIRMDRFANGKIVESWNNWNTLGRSGQTGALPEPREPLDPAPWWTEAA
ncbi:MAG TPA: ester cyclase [Thermoanaerobaculia bacterium]